MFTESLCVYVRLYHIEVWICVFQGLMFTESLCGRDVAVFIFFKYDSFVMQTAKKENETIVFKNDFFCKMSFL